MHARTAIRPLTAVVAVVVLVLALAACGKDSKTSAATTTTKGDTSTTAKADDDAASTVTAKNIAFTPTSLTVKAGADVYFANGDAIDHTMTADPGQAATFDTGHVVGGKTVDFKAPAPGTYTFHCAIHSSMKGTLTVQ